MRRVLVAALAVAAVTLTGGPALAALFVSSANTNQVLRYNETTGAFEGVFASGLSNPEGLAFGTGGDLFVANRGTNQVLRFDGTTGAAKGVFASGGGLGVPTFLAFSPAAPPPPAAVPEPASLALVGVGAAGLIGARLRRRKPAAA